MATRRRPLHEDISEVEVEGGVTEPPVDDFGQLRKRVAAEHDLLLHGSPAEDPHGSTTTRYTAIVITAGVLVVLACVACAWDSALRPATPDVVDEDWVSKNLIKDIRTVRDVFPSQSKTIWLDLYSGIRKVLLEKPTEPSVFLLLHEGVESTSACLARLVGRVAHDHLNASEPGPLVLQGSQLQGEDSGLLVDSYRLPVERHRILIVHNLQRVPPTIARGFHAMCDTVTPLVRKAVYIFTLAVGGGGGNPTAVAERELYTAWGQLDMDVLSPLVVRITGGSVFRVQPEEGVNTVC